MIPSTGAGSPRWPLGLVVAVLAMVGWGFTPSPPAAELGFLVTGAASPTQFNIGMPPQARFSGACGTLSFKGTDEELQALRSVRSGVRGTVRIRDEEMRGLLTDDGTLVLVVDARVMPHPYLRAELEVTREGFKSVRDCGRGTGRGG